MRGQDLGGRIGIDPAHQCGQRGRVEAVYSGTRCRQLHQMSAIRREVQVRPGDDVLSGRRCDAAQTQPAQHRAESDLNAENLQAAGSGEHQHNVGNAGQPLANHVDDLGVEHIAAEQDLIGFPLMCRGDLVGTQHHLPGVEVRHRRPGQHQLGVMATGDDQPLHEVRLGPAVQPHGQVGQPADHPAIGSPHVPAGQPGEQQHTASMPHSAAPTAPSRCNHPS